MNSKSTLVIGASLNPQRYAHKAMILLQKKNHPVLAVGLREGEVNGILIRKGEPQFEGIDTITVYVGEKNLGTGLDYILGLKPKRIILNPGAENAKLSMLARNEGIEVLNACTLVMLNTGQY